MIAFIDSAGARTRREGGGNFADTADVYPGGGTEAMLGRFLKGGNRDQMVIATKAGFLRTQVTTLARVHGLPEPVVLRYSYLLIDRGVELDVLPAGQALGIGLVTWSPVGAGMLPGKYGREKLKHQGPAGSLPDRGGDTPSGGSDGRVNGGNPSGGMLFTEANFVVLDTLRAVAEEIGRPMAKVALAWVMAPQACRRF